MTILKKLQGHLSSIRNVKFNPPLQGNITNIISNYLILAVLFIYFITTSWYFIFNTDVTDYVEFFESRYYLISAIVSLAVYLEVFRTRSDYNQFFEDFALMVEKR